MNTPRNTIEISPVGLIFNVKTMGLKFKRSGPSGKGYEFEDFQQFPVFFAFKGGLRGGEGGRMALRRR